MSGSLIASGAVKASQARDVPSQTSRIAYLKDSAGKSHSLKNCKALLRSFRQQHSKHSATRQVIEHENFSRKLAAEVEARDAHVELQKETRKFEEAITKEAQRKEDHINECVDFVKMRINVAVEKVWELGVVEGDVDAVAEQKERH
ncbi:hypothetical protein EK21DRAFT_106091 [Setomelanomma holmii]|uniref:Uncharacterized protein n=1 Tax=Setomelanomma holmii TaxID=210430 RepID=A0A9P4LUG5_9PLEO|nr:hypothetical protein EK21DRAFT_106091 [Setomelanomma holmii]